MTIDAHDTDVSDPRRTVEGMTTTTTNAHDAMVPEAPALRRGDICPDWCGGEHVDNRTDAKGRPVHPDDSYRRHASPLIDSWLPLYGENGQPAEKPVTVEIEGHRHDFDTDWPDMILAEGVSPDEMARVALRVPDARRLGKALLRACDLAYELPSEAGMDDISSLPSFGMVRIEAASPDRVPAGCLGQHDTEMLDDLSAHRLRQLAADALAAASWLEARA